MTLRDSSLTLVTAMIAAVGGCAAPPVAAPPPPPPAAAVGATTVVAVAPAPAGPYPTLWDFLGVTQLLGCVQAEVQTKIACLGYYLPWIEHGPPVLPLTDPANLESANPAIATAAAVKAEEEAAAQKIKALRYLATIGCGGCYPGIEEAFLAALDDCTEEVRYEAAKALNQTVGNPCKFCRDKACCSPAVRKKLDEIANGVDGNFCFKEPSARVRRMARLAMNGCGPPPPEPVIIPSYEGPPPIEGPLPGEILPMLPPPELMDPYVPPGPPPPGPLPPPPPPAAANGPELVAPETEATTVRRRSSVNEDTPIRQASTADDMVVARVNGEPITRSEILAVVNRRLQSLPAEQRTPAARRTLAERELRQAVDRKLWLQDAREQGQLSEIIAAVAHADDKLSNETRLVAAWIRRAVVVDETVTRQQIAAWHEAHIDEYQAPAEVRWEQIGAPLARTSSRERLHAAVSYLRERALGAQVEPPLEANLKAVRTETFDWTRPASVRSQVVARALAILPIGKISPVLEDESGIYVVRVLEHRGSEPIPVEQVAADIHEKILHECRARAQEMYVQRLRARARLWTYHEGEDPQRSPVEPVSASAAEPMEENPLFTDQWQPLPREH